MKYYKNSFFSALLLMCCLSQTVYAQKDFKNQSENVFHLGFSYAFQIPGGDMANRFGNSSMIGFHPRYKTRSNFLFGVESNFLFGQDVKQKNLLHDIVSEKGEIFDENSGLASVFFLERGFSVTPTIGKIFTPGFSPNPNCGIMVEFGAGILQHKIKLDIQNQRIPQITGEYAKGYDRLTSGITLKQSIGWYNLSASKLVNFTLSFEFYQAFTQSKRDYNFDDKAKDTTKRLDLLFGIKASWMIPFYKRMSTEFYID